MFLETWIAFVIASSVLLLIPGPTVLIVVSYALAKGVASIRTTVSGAIFGDFTAMTISLMGAGAILAASATLFTILKLLGALYLIWLGIQLWRAKPSAQALAGTAQSIDDRGMFWSSYIVTALNPKSIVFFIAFVPQFVNPEAPLLLQFVMLEATFLALATISLIAWAMLASKARSGLQKPSALRAVNRAGGGFLVAAGLITASASRAN